MKYDFEHYLQAGHGRAYVIARADPERYRDRIMAACRKDYSFEGTVLKVDTVCGFLSCLQQFLPLPILLRLKIVTVLQLPLALCSSSSVALSFVVPPHIYNEFLLSKPSTIMLM